MRLPHFRRNLKSRVEVKRGMSTMIRKSGTANRAADLRIDAVARESAQAVRAAGNAGATERFLGRFLDHLYEADNKAHGLDDAELARLRRRCRRRKDGN
jgi:hypothetical protein